MVRKMPNDSGMGLKEFIEDLVASYKEDKDEAGLRKAGRALGIDWQRLQYWIKSGKKQQELLDFLEKARKDRGISKTAMWDRLTK